MNAFLWFLMGMILTIACLIFWRKYNQKFSRFTDPLKKVVNSILDKFFLSGIVFILSGLLLASVCMAHEIDKAELQKASAEAAAEADFNLQGYEQDLKIKLEQCRTVFLKEFLSHSTIYADWDHLWFSWLGYRNPTCEDVFRSYVYGWWGCEIQVRIEVDE